MQLPAGSTGTQPDATGDRRPGRRGRLTARVQEAGGKTPEAGNGRRAEVRGAESGRCISHMTNLTTSYVKKRRHSRIALASEPATLQFSKAA